MTTAPAQAPAPSLSALCGRAMTAFTRGARTAAGRVADSARRGGATLIGVAGLASIAVGAGAQWGWPVGLMVGGPLAVWFASLLDDEK